MALVDIKDMLNHAYAHGYALGAFDLVSLDFLQGVICAAERARAPVILSLAEPHFSHFDFEIMLPAVEAAARRSAVPIAIQLDHGTSRESAVRAIRHGCNGVMLDVSHESLGENIRLTREVVEMAHACGIPVEGELGYVPGVEGEDAEHHPGELSYTTVAEARGYVEKTGVDFLAVSIGTVHGRLKGKPRLDVQRLKQINEALGIPLAVHGGSGLSDDQYHRLITHGVAKINYYTALADIAGRCVYDNAASDRSRGYTGLAKGVADAICAEVERCLRVWGSAGRAAEVMAQCRPWLPVEHVIIYNVAESAVADMAMLMAEGRRRLAKIPGVREVMTGEAVREDARYRYTWLVKFCHPAVIDSYRDHPDHVAFANSLFRPIAGDRITIDYQCIE